MYSEYCSNHVKAMETLRRLMKENKEFDSFLRVRLEDCSNWEACSCAVY